MNRNTIKYIAILAMVIDHIGMFFMTPDENVVLYAICRSLGRITAPVMCYFLVEGFIYTSSRLKYGIRLLVFGLISQVPYALSHHNSLLEPDFNMILMLFLSYLCLCSFAYIHNNALRLTAIALLTLMSLWCDWGLFGPIMVLVFYLNHNNMRGKTIGYIVTVLSVNVLEIAYLAGNGSHWYGELWQLGMFLFLPFMYAYNENVGSRKPFHRWFFYIFYPAHLGIIWAIKYWLM